METASATAITSKVLKARSIGWPMASPTKTSTGAMSNATWALEPTAIEHREVHPVLHRHQDRRAVLGRVADDRNDDEARRKSRERPMSAIAASVDPTRISESQPTTPADTQEH